MNRTTEFGPAPTGPGDNGVTGPVGSTVEPYPHVVGASGGDQRLGLGLDFGTYLSGGPAEAGERFEGQHRTSGEEPREGRAMDPTEEFFEALNHHPPFPLLGRVRGTIRFELESAGDVEIWLLVMSGGSVSATPSDRSADLTVRTDRRFFDQIIEGRANLFAALLRNRVSVQGKLSLYPYLDHLVPGPPGAHEPRDWVRQRRQRR